MAGSDWHNGEKVSRQKRILFADESSRSSPEPSMGSIQEAFVKLDALLLHPLKSDLDLGSHQTENMRISSTD